MRTQESRRTGGHSFRTAGFLGPSAVLLCTLVAFGAAGCSFAGPQTQMLTINSDPSGADVIINGRTVGKTPLQYEVDRGQDAMIQISKAGYRTEHIGTTRSLSEMGWLDIVGGCFLIVPWIGLVSPGAYMHEPDMFQVTLRPLADTAGTGVAVAPPIDKLPPVLAKPTPTEAATALAVTGIRQRFAVCIGISEYQDPAIERLPLAAKDAQDIARLLKSQPGMSVDTVKLLTDRDATKRNIEDALEGFLSKAGRDDLIFLYWSGHGFPDATDDTKVYFACNDTILREPYTGYRMDKVRTSLEEKGCRNVIIVADTCHAGRIVTRDVDRGIVGIASGVKSIKAAEIPKGQIFMVAADADRKAVEISKWSNGAFTHVLLQGLNGAADGYMASGEKDGIVTFGEIRAYMLSQFPEQTRTVLGKALHPIILVNTGDARINDLPLSRVP